MKKKEIIFVTIFAIILATVFYFSNKNHINKFDNTIPKVEEFSISEEEESVLVDEYIRKNISTIATDSPVLGGTWYVVSTSLDPSLDQGTVVYEDGHIQSTASFRYKYENNTVIITEFIVSN